MESVHFWTEAPESFTASTYCGVEAIKLSGRVIIIEAYTFILRRESIFLHLRYYKMLKSISKLFKS